MFDRDFIEEVRDIQRKRRQGHRYSVYVGLYASKDVKAMVERHEEDFTHPEHFAAQLFY